MVRGYRCIVVAIFGWLSLTAQAPQQRTPQPQDRSDQIAAALQNVSAALNRQNKAPQANPPCEQGSDNRNSDLCAQWKAADAAARAADASESATNAAWVFGYVGTFIGLLTLAAASAAAWYARKAAIHTEESAVEARRAADAAEETLSLANKTSEIELRAYIRSLEDTVTRDKKNPGMLNVTLHYKNAGETPAHNVEMTVDTSFETLESEIGLRTKAFGKSASIGSQKCFNWGTEGKEADFLCYFDVNLSEEQIAKIEDGTGVLVLKSIMFFQDEFGVKWANAHDYYINGHALENNAVYTRFSETQRVEEKSKPKRRSSKRA